MIFTVEEILEATGGSLVRGKSGTVFSGISTDSRSVKQGEIFFALKGSRYDGHDFLADALGKGAAGVLIDERRTDGSLLERFPAAPVIAVRDTLSALGDLARSRRRRFGVSVVAITGSNGKTTTKEMVYAVLASSFRVLKTEGNLNNLVGLPLTLLGLRGDESIAVVEMGTNVPGEIRRLTEIAEPDVGLITNIQMVHLEGLGDLEGVKEEKGELFKRMRSDGTIIVNHDDPGVVELANAYLGQKITYAIDRPSDFMAENIRLSEGEGTRFTVVSNGRKIDVVLPVGGRQFVPNALAALAVSSHYGIDLEKAREALACNFHPPSRRMQIRTLPGNIRLIDDSYNANPRSMEMALETLSELKGKSRGIAVLGDMLELGNFSESAHRNLGERVSGLKIELLVALGDRAATVVEAAIRHGLDAASAKVAKDPEEAIDAVKELVREGDWILVKGSRAMAMERVVEGLIRSFHHRERGR